MPGWLRSESMAAIVGMRTREQRCRHERAPVWPEASLKADREPPPKKADLAGRFSNAAVHRARLQEVQALGSSAIGPRKTGIRQIVQKLLDMA